MAALIDDADYDAGETSENVSSPQSDAGNHDNYCRRRLWTSCTAAVWLDNKVVHATSSRVSDENLLSFLSSGLRQAERRFKAKWLQYIVVEPPSSGEIN
ncbi:unnamed protein product [Protopolystoma xenopodis]|uniref:Uncharacterized protein n=1 Tax=Protopolystoma xenopodis TaxID=117903 RepID=A0A3S5C6F8_9PLAT|nr:unnamed protein product [Protopolystoma xenopodis]